MKPTFVVEETIARPAADVWALLTDWRRAHLWMNSVDSMRSEGAIATGTEVTFVARGKERGATIAQCDPGRQMTLRSVQGGVTADYSYELEPIDPYHTHVRLVARCASEGLVWKLAYPVISYAIRATDAGQLRALKQLAEGQVG